MEIPRKFKVFASTITVSVDNERLSEGGILGDCSFNDQRIGLCEVYKGKELPKDCVIDTFYHEKVHIILDAMGEHRLSRNEKFVEVFSRLLRQADDSAEYKPTIKP